MFYNNNNNNIKNNSKMANDDDLSMSSSFTFSSTVTKYYNFDGDRNVRVFDRTTGIERANIIGVISDNENNDNRNGNDNDNDNDNVTHQSAISI